MPAVAFASQLERELTAVTEQRDAITLRLGNTQERMIDAERQRDRLAENLERALNATVLNHRNERWHIDAEHTLQLLKSLTPNEL